MKTEHFLKVKSFRGFAVLKTSGTYLSLVILIGLGLFSMSPIVDVVTVEAISTTYYVDDDGSPNGNGTIENPFDDINDALAVANDDDIIEVLSGTYEENIVINRDGLKMEAYQGEPVCIEGDHNSDTVFIPANSVQFLDIDIEATGIQKSSYDGIAVAGSSVTISELYVKDHAIGIHIENTNDMLVNYCTLTDNYKHGIRVFSSYDISIEDCVIWNNLKDAEYNPDAYGLGVMSPDMFDYL